MLKLRRDQSLADTQTILLWAVDIQIIRFDRTCNNRQDLKQQYRTGRPWPWPGKPVYCKTMRDKREIID